MSLQGKLLSVWVHVLNTLKINFFKGETVLFSRDYYTVLIRFIEEQYQKFIILKETFLKLF